MKKLFCSCFAIFLLTASFGWTVEIAVSDRIPNQSPGFCGWASLSSIGRHHKIPALYDLVENRVRLGLPSSMGDADAKEVLDSLKIKYYHRPAGSFNRDLLKYANTDGVCVGMKLGAFPDLTSPHEIILTWYGQNIVYFEDPNDIKWDFKHTRQWFDSYWDGSSILIRGVDQEK